MQQNLDCTGLITLQYLPHMEKIKQLATRKSAKSRHPRRNENLTANPFSKISRNKP